MRNKINDILRISSIVFVIILAVMLVLWALISIWVVIPFTHPLVTIFFKIVATDAVLLAVSFLSYLISELN